MIEAAVTIFRVAAVILGTVCICAVVAGVLIFEFAPWWQERMEQRHADRREKFREGLRRG